MATQSPFSWVQELVQNFKLPFGFSLEPPPWLAQEFQRRILLLLNYVLAQEPQAMQRLVRQKGRVVHAQWRGWAYRLQITPAGLLDLADEYAKADLTLVLTQESPTEIARALAQGKKPAVRIEGDVQLAAEVNWLADHVRWDVEEDLSRIIGDVAAHRVCDAARATGQALRHFAAQRRTSQTDAPTDASSKTHSGAEATAPVTGFTP
jgi:ubiquinone biosynthesis accessory factor UbiJ